jgi:hypothetical protein
MSEEREGNTGVNTNPIAGAGVPEWRERPGRPDRAVVTVTVIATVLCALTIPLAAQLAIAIPLLVVGVPNDTFCSFPMGPWAAALGFVFVAGGLLMVVSNVSRLVCAGGGQHSRSGRCLTTTLLFVPTALLAIALFGLHIYG